MPLRMIGGAVDFLGVVLGGGVGAGLALGISLLIVFMTFFLMVFWNFGLRCRILLVMVSIRVQGRIFVTFFSTLGGTIAGG